jgi:O-methyltransferase
MRKYFPRVLKNVYHKLVWFFMNYNKINKFSYLSKIGGPFNYETDGLATHANADFICEPRFSEAYRLAKETNPWPNFTLQWRIHIVLYFAELAKKLEGDFVECGVNTGAYARAIIQFVNFNSLNKTFHLFDTFNGLVAELISDEEIQSGVGDYLNSYRDTYHEVLKTFENFNVQVIKGVVPESLLQYRGSDKICFLSLDMNCMVPEIAALNFFWDKLVIGGVIIIDDYGFPQHINQKKAYDKFAQEKGEIILCLPTAQGIIIKNK